MRYASTFEGLSKTNPSFRIHCLPGRLAPGLRCRWPRGRRCTLFESTKAQRHTVSNDRINTVRCRGIFMWDESTPPP